MLVKARVTGEFSILENNAMLGVGGLMGLRTSGGVLLGALLNFALLGPWMIHLGESSPAREPRFCARNGGERRVWIVSFRN
jgi:uncharacterized oligopeptide transporter (OPT) family protein